MKKYKIHFINDKRYYEFDMTNILPSLDETIPYYFKYDDIEIYANAWNKMTLGILSALDNKNHKSNDEIIYTYAYTLDEISVLKPNQYADKMHLKKLDNYFLFFEEASDEYIQIDESKLIKKDKIDIEPAVLDKIEKELLYYLDSFGSIDSETYAGYNSMPSLNVSWNKYLLLGLCRTYFNELISIKYDRKQYKKLTFKLELKQK